jgi:hypothetical protein
LVIFVVAENEGVAVAGAGGHVQALGGSEVVARGATDFAEHQGTGLQAFFHGPQGVGYLAGLDQQDMLWRDAQPGEGVGGGPAKIMRLRSDGANPENGSIGLLFPQGTGEQPGLKT